MGKDIIKGFRIPSRVEMKNAGKAADSCVRRLLREPGGRFVAISCAITALEGVVALAPRPLPREFGILAAGTILSVVPTAIEFMADNIREERNARKRYEEMDKEMKRLGIK